MNLDKIVVATNNKHKAEEIAKLLGFSSLLTLKDLGVADIEEYGKTLEDNASIKSDYVYKKYNIPCIGDDSGLFISALGGEPGIYSARYSGPEKNDFANNGKVISKMMNIDIRNAYFKTVISYSSDSGCQLFEGILNGKIAHLPKGSNGFGYDPIFIPDGYDDITLAEMDMDRKNKLSHRAIAIQKFVLFFNSIHPSSL
jgi:XTP/dITP diphosphohydrolase